MTTLPAASSARTPARLDAGDARPAVAAVGRDPGLRAGQADGGDARARGAPSTGASRSGARRSRAGRRARADPGSSVMAAARPSSSSVVSPMAQTTTTRSWPAARSRAMRRATRLMRSASATDEPPNFWTTREAGMSPGILPCGSRAGPTMADGRCRDPCASISTAVRRSHPSPAARSTSVARCSPRPMARAVAAFHALAAEPIRCRGRHPARRPRSPSRITKSSRCGSRSTASTPSRSTGSAGPPGRSRAATSSSTCRTSRGRPGPGSRPTSRRAWRRSAKRSTAAAPPRAVFTLGFCMGGRMSFLAGALGLDLAGVDRAVRDARRAVAQRRAGSGRCRRVDRRAGPRPLRRRGRRPSRPRRSPLSTTR